MEEIPLEFRNVHELYKCYMPFLQNGGLFFETNRLFEMGHSLALSVLLPNSLEPIVVTGKVAWITPTSAHSSAPQGVGVSFIDDKEQLRDRIDNLLGTLANSSEITHTM